MIEPKRLGDEQLRLITRGHLEADERFHDEGFHLIPASHHHRGYLLAHIAALEAEIKEYKPAFILQQIRAGNFTVSPLPDQISDDPRDIQK